MNNKQSSFNKLFQMLGSTNIQTELVSECISVKDSELFFSRFDSDKKVEKEHIYNVYKTRFELEQNLRPKSHFVVGYKDLLPKLKKSELEFINVSSLMTKEGGFIIFSDYEYSEFIGILRSKRTLEEVKEKQKGFEHLYKSTVFENGILK